MNINQYQEDCKRTIIPEYITDELFSEINYQHILHAHIGLSSEVGEIGDAIKKCLIYNQSLDLENIKEEIGDVMWYLSLLASSCNISLEDCMQHNVDKLKIRYPHMFTTDLAKERLDKK